MITNIEFDISIQEIICWVLLFLFAWNPNGMFSGMIEAVGYKIPLLVLASGAGQKTATKFLNSKGDS